jgi:hypothetical protein
MDGSFKYWQTNLAELEATYPYTAKDGTCAYKAASGKVNTKSYVDVKANSINDLISAVNVGPVSIAIEADQLSFQSYKSGILADNGKCGGWLRLRAAADCGPSLAPGGGLQDVRAEWQQAVLTFPWQLTTNLELFRLKHHHL